jgi:hypothetical protein
MFRGIVYWIVLVLSVLFVLGSIVVFVVTYVNIRFHLESARQVPLKDLVPVGTLVLTATSTFSAVFFAWRVDRRQAKELELKTKDLEMKMKELELKLASAQVANTQPPTQQFPNF